MHYAGFTDGGAERRDKSQGAPALQSCILLQFEDAPHPKSLTLALTSLHPKSQIKALQTNAIDATTRASTLATQHAHTHTNTCSCRSERVVALFDFLP